MLIFFVLTYSYINLCHYTTLVGRICLGEKGGAQRCPWVLFRIIPALLYACMCADKATKPWAILSDQNLAA